MIDNPLLRTISAVLAQVAEETPLVFSATLEVFIQPLRQQFTPRQFSVLPAVDLTSLAAGLSLALRMKESEKRDLNIKQQSDKDVVIFAEAGETFGATPLNLFRLKYPWANLLYVCLDSQLWGISTGESSFSTPRGARTLSTPVEPEPWWKIFPIDCFDYAAQGCFSHADDFRNKVGRAVNLAGLRYLHLLAPSPLYWGFPGEELEEVARAAVEAGFWPLFEIEEGHGRINLEIKKVAGLMEFYRRQGRFAHLFTEDGQVLAKTEKALEDSWKDLRNKLKAPPP